MSEKLTYNLTIGAEQNSDVEEIEEKLQSVLLDLYDQGEVESIRVTKDGYAEQEISVDGFMDLVEDVTSEDIRRSIDLVRKLEDLDVDDE
jgi:signal transduction histidine kinase